MARYVRAIAVNFLFVGSLVGCHKSISPPISIVNDKPAKVSVSEPLVQVNPSSTSLQVSAKWLESGIIEFTVTTNLPTPLAAMASVDLQGQKDKDTAIGTSKKVTLTGPKTVFSVKAVNDVDGMDGLPLPKGNYDADVIVGPKWAENKEIASLHEILEAKQTITIRSGRERVFVEHRNELQKWVIDNVPMDTPWDEPRFKMKLGLYDKSISTNSPLVDVFYFPDADMTLIVSRVSQRVLTWRAGRATS